MLKLIFGRIVPVLALITELTLVTGRAEEFRGVWVDAWGAGFLDANQVTKLISDCRTYNFNAIVVQMRRRGDAFYTPGISGNDPKTTAISSSFDALADIISKAHSGSPRIEVHCWVTTFLVWSSTTQPSQAGHVFRAHPEYLMRDSTGTNYIAEGYYLDPGNPDATLWNYVMATNIVRRYAVDGFHWDYVRYPTTDSGYNPVAISRYNTEFGLTGQPSPTSPQFSNWRRRQVTDFLRWVNGELLAIRPNLAVSCAVFGSRSDAYNARYQDWAAWNTEGIIDICMPMGYTAGNGTFTSRVDDAFNNQGVRRVYNGQGAYLNTKENTVWQLDYVRSKGLMGSVFYSYRTPNSGTVNQAATFAYVRDNHQPTWENVPAIPWKASPAKGVVRGTVTRSDSGATIYNATVTLQTAPARTQLTEAHGSYGFFETPPGTYTITATAPGLGTVTNNVTVTAGGNLTRNMVVPAADNTPPVISEIAAGNITDTAATITWTTDEPANTVVDYGTTIPYGAIFTNAALTTSHTAVLNSLAANATYQFRVRSRNAAGLQSVSGNMVFKTNPAGVVNDVIVESRQPDGSLTGAPTYSDSGFADSTLKSTAAGLSGTGSRYGASGSPTYTLRPNLAVAGGTYDVYLTHGVASSISDDIVVSISQSGCTGLPSQTAIHRETGGNTWEYLGRIQCNAGVSVPTVTFTHASGVLSGTSRMYSDSAKFVYVAPPQPPTITSQPEPRSVVQGASAAFTVSSTGASPLSYQWVFEGATLQGATASTYTVLNAQPVHEGEYRVVITNVAGSLTSAPAFLQVLVPPAIASQPANQSVRQGAAVELFVTASGSEPLSFQWRFEGTNLSGATDSSYQKLGVQPADAGAYSVLITNAAGSVLSDDALLSVTLPTPPLIESIDLPGDGSVRLRVTGDSNVVYALEASTNLTVWETVSSASSPDGHLEFIDDPGPDAPVRLYRVRELQGTETP